MPFCPWQGARRPWGHSPQRRATPSGAKGRVREFRGLAGGGYIKDRPCCARLNTTYYGAGLIASARSAATGQWRLPDSYWRQQACWTNRMKEPISSAMPEWERERVRGFWDPGRQLLRTIRRYQAARERPGWGKGLLAKYFVLSHRFWSLVTGADIPLNSRIGGGLLIPHPNGIVIHPDAVIGPNCLFFQQVTIGSNGGGVPCIGGHVDIGAGARILGSVVIGEHARVGANAVVLRDVPAGGTAVGVPARIITTDDRRGG